MIAMHLQNYLYLGYYESFKISTKNYLDYAVLYSTKYVTLGQFEQT